MDVRFREVDPFNWWLWLRFSEIPSQGERNYLDGVFDSWYVIGRLGGFNAENLQVHEEGADLSWMGYDNDEANALIPALMHNMGQRELGTRTPRRSTPPTRRWQPPKRRGCRPPRM